MSSQNRANTPAPAFLSLFHREQLASVLVHMPTVASANLLCAIVISTAAILRTEPGQAIWDYALFICGMVAMAGAIMAFWYRWRRGLPPEQVERALEIYTVLAALRGILCGFGYSIALASGETLTIIFALEILAGLSAAGYAISAQVIRAAHACIVPMLVIPCATLLWMGTHDTAWMAAGFLIYLGFIVMTGTRIHRQFRTGIEAVFERETLLAREIALRQEIEAAKRDADQAARLKSEFLANMSHEVRTPLNGLLGAVQVLETMPLGQHGQSLITIAKHSAESLLAVISDVLDMSRLETGSIVVEPVPTDLAALAEKAKAAVAPKIAGKKLALTVEIDPSLPPKVTIDPDRTRQVLVHLLDNAVKFTASGSIRVEMRREVCVGGDAVCFSVSDSGIGIERGAQVKLFTRFYQVDGSLRRQFGGTGLGLAISKGLVDCMGGTIGCASEAGVGSTFWFKLPLDHQRPMLKQAS